MKSAEISENPILTASGIKNQKRTGFLKFRYRCEKLKSGKLKLIIVDVIDNIKSIGYDTWYKSNTDLAEGVWIGNGISNQFTFKITTNSRILRQELEPKFGFVLEKGKATVIKLLSDE